jgi:hypothetical protein
MAPSATAPSGKAWSEEDDGFVVTTGLQRDEGSFGWLEAGECTETKAVEAKWTAAQAAAPRAMEPEEQQEAMAATRSDRFGRLLQDEYQQCNLNQKS